MPEVLEQQQNKKTSTNTDGNQIPLCLCMSLRKMTEVEFIKSLSDKIKSGQTTVTYMVKGKWSNKGYKKLE